MNARWFMFGGFLAASLALTSACNPAAAPAVPAADLTIEEHRLIEAPTLEPLAFKPVEGSMDTILARHAAERSKIIPDGSMLIDGHLAMRATFGSDTLTATEYYSPDSPTGWVTVMRGDKEVYRIDTGMPSPITGLQGLWVYDEHWVLETAYITPDSFSGRLSVDGTLLVPRGGLDQAFDFQLMHGRPFYFLSKLGHIGFSYDGREVPSGYDEIPHYQCCSASVLNPRHAENMVAFFARHSDTWYYVEIGVFQE